mmetsp:Transcript_9995/g.16920  ORF Transcript_9995/g.16920 Transcript_9995/m.16920 type:complete len:307 (+) Transcript_9995:76-996(+)
MSIATRLATLRAFPGTVFAAYGKTYERRPMLMAGITMGTKAGGCDTLAQWWADPEAPIDFIRIGKFTSFCILYVGSFQHVIFNIVYPRLFPGPGFVAGLQKTVFDNFVHSPVIYLPAYYAFKAAAEGNTVYSGLEEYYNEGWQVLKACWGVWVPAQFFNFWLVPPNFRILFIAVFGCAWEMILSSMAPMDSSTTAAAPNVHATPADTAVVESVGGGGEEVATPRREHAAGDLATKGEPETGPLDLLPLSPVRSHKTKGQSAASRNCTAGPATAMPPGRLSSVASVSSAAPVSSDVHVATPADPRSS